MAITISGTDGVGITGNVGALTAGTAVAASGTSVDITGIPSWAKRVTVMLNGVSTNGTTSLRFQLGDSGGIETTGYSSTCTQLGTSALTLYSTSGFDGIGDGGATFLRNGQLVFALIGTNIWTLCGAYNIGAAFQYLYSGTKTLSDTLDRVRITTTNGTDTFDAGSINILFE